MRAIEALELEREIRYTERQGDARRFAEEAAAENRPVRIYACGGDGTLNEVVNGAAGHDHVAVTSVPKGTGNDFLKIFGPSYHTLFTDLKELSAGPQTPFDLIHCNGMLGLDVVCAGFDARVGVGVHRFKGIPLVSGKMAYILSLISVLVTEGLSQSMRLETEGTVWEGDTTILCVFNGRYYGGGFMPVDDAMPDDGVLDTLLVPRVGFLTFARLVGKYAKGRYRELRPLVKDFHGQGMVISAEQPFVVAVDGEAMYDRRFEIRLSGRKVNFFYPQGADYAPKVVTQG